MPVPCRIVLTIDLPNASGCRALRVIKRIRRTKRIELPGGVDLGMRGHAANLGADALICLPSQSYASFILSSPAKSRGKR
jgi:hypothetical protein